MIRHALEILKEMEKRGIDLELLRESLFLEWNLLNSVEAAWEYIQTFPEEIQESKVDELQELLEELAGLR